MMLAVILFLVLPHWSDENTLAEMTTSCPKGMERKSSFPEYNGTLFVPLIGRPYKNGDLSKQLCENLNGEPANIYSNKQMKMIMKFIRNNPGYSGAFNDHGGAVSLQLGMKCVYDYQTKKNGVKLNTGQLALGLKQHAYTQWKRNSPAILRVSEKEESETQYLYSGSGEEEYIGVLCEIPVCLK